MRKKYRFVFRIEKAPELHSYIVANCKRLSCKIGSGGIDFTVLNVKEGDFGWEVASRFIEVLRPQITLEYLKSELADAQWFSIRDTGNFGYPKPQDKWSTTRFTHRHYDHKSGVCSHQIAPYRISQNPKNKKHFVGLHWVADLFVRSEVCDLLRRNNISGWKRWPVMMNGPNIESTVVSQLEILESLDFSSSTEGLTNSTTASGYTKFLQTAATPIRYSEKLLEVSSDIVCSQEIYGAVRNARRMILVSRRFYDLYLAQKWKGLRFEPIFIV